LPEAVSSAALDRLIERLSQSVALLMEGLENGRLDVNEWREAMERELLRYYTAAYMTGQDSPDLTTEARSVIRNYVNTQIKYLDNFALVIQTAEAFEQGWKARAEMYANGIKAPYWQGRVKVLALPAMPGDGTTQCLTNCGCEWDIQVVDEDKGDYDAYWVRGKQDSCQTCLEREAQWNPLQIRGGVLMIPPSHLAKEIAKNILEAAR
jgi:hypothetical protein